MSRTKYSTLEEVKKDLHVLRLERDISLAELENKKLEMEQGLSTFNILTTAFDALKKYGAVYLIRRIFG